MAEKECKLLNYINIDEISVKVADIGRCSVYEYPEIEKELNIYLKHGWKITPINLNTFYLEREKK